MVSIVPHMRACVISIASSGPLLFNSETSPVPLFTMSLKRFLHCMHKKPTSGFSTVWFMDAQAFHARG
eukprot:jgi/Botrbrau1/7679/Bobra.0159s0121.1